MMAQRAIRTGGRLIDNRRVAGRPPTTKDTKRNARKTFTPLTSGVSSVPSDATKCASHFGMRELKRLSTTPIDGMPAQFVGDRPHLLRRRDTVTDDEQIGIRVANQTKPGAAPKYRRHVEHDTIELLLQVVDQLAEERTVHERFPLCVGNPPGSKNHQPKILGLLQC